MTANNNVLAVYQHETLPHNPRHPKSQLFNLADDIGEKQDLAKDKPDLVAKLHQSWLDWSATLPPRANPQ